MRVNQLEAAQLDKDVILLLSMQLRRIFRFFSPAMLMRYKAELDSLLHLLLYRFTIALDKPTPGAALQNLQYRNEGAFDFLDSIASDSTEASHELLFGSSSNESLSASLDSGSSVLPPSISPLSSIESPIAGSSVVSPSSSDNFLLPLQKVSPLTTNQKLLYALFFIGGRYAWTRLNETMTDAGWGAYPEGHYLRRIYSFCRFLDHAYRIAAIINFLSFLINGRYRSLIERFLKIRLVYIHSKVARQVNFEFMNQQLLWHGFAEFWLFMSPLLNFDGIFRGFRRVFRFFSGPVPDNIPGCGVCRADPILTPYRANCGHLFCYYCVRASRMAETVFRCPRCSERIHSESPAGNPS